MPIIQVAEGDQFEDKPVAEGEYDLRIEKAEKKDSKKGNPMVVCLMKIEGSEGDEAPLVRENLMVPEEGSEHYRFQMRNLHRFCALFGIESFDPDNPDDIANLEGLTARCYLTIDVDDDSGNEYNRLRLPKIKQRR